MDNTPKAILDLLDGLSGMTRPVRVHLQRMRTARDPESCGEPRFTHRGTRCSRAWDDAWIAAVETREEELGKRICGARTPSGTPCPLDPNHDNGRCRFHGGFNLTGAPEGNRNAVVHGLYSRRLMVCGPHCHLWKACPCATKEVEAMDEKDRPICPYEQVEYNTAVTEGMALVDTGRNANPFDRHVVHALAMLQVLMSRSATAMGRARLTQRSVSPDGKPGNDRPSAEVQVFMRILWEYRHMRKLLSPYDLDHTPESAMKQIMRMEVDTDLTPESQEELHFPPDPEDSLAAASLLQAEGRPTGKNFTSLVTPANPPKRRRRRQAGCSGP
ncbi:MAG: hypothetical protein AMXMBFR84_19670 [Candidatus Hydrogenedentota bacterium]